MQVEVARVPPFPAMPCHTVVYAVTVSRWCGNGALGVEANQQEVQPGIVVLQGVLST